MSSKVAAVFLAALFPIVVNTQAGAQHVDSLWVRATQAFGGRPFDVVVKVVLPAALPAIMAGLRLALGRAVVTVVVAEMYVSLAGVGQLLQTFGNAGRTAELIALTSVVAGCGSVGVVVLHRLLNVPGSVATGRRGLRTGGGDRGVSALGRWYRRHEGQVLGAIGLAVLLGSWEIAATLEVIDPAHPGEPRPRGETCSWPASGAPGNCSPIWRPAGSSSLSRTRWPCSRVSPSASSWDWSGMSNTRSTPWSGSSTVRRWWSSSRS